MLDLQSPGNPDDPFRLIIMRVVRVFEILGLLILAMVAGVLFLIGVGLDVLFGRPRYRPWW